MEIFYSNNYSKEFINNFAEYYNMILHDILEVESMSEIGYTSNNDIKLLNRYNQIESPLLYDDVLDGFNDNLAKNPDNILVSYGDTSYTYVESAFIADKIANSLRDAGVESQDYVAYLVERSEWYLLVSLGILSMGAVYVPLDDALPDKRLKFMLEDAGVKAIIASDETYERAKDLANNLAVLNVNDIVDGDVGCLDTLNVNYGKLACILYTSCTTGRPKGVKITRLAVINNVG